MATGMKRCAAIRAVAVLAAAQLPAAPLSALVAASPQPHVPERFQGEWNRDLEHCGTGIGQDRLVIEADRIRYYESGGRVIAAVTRGHELAIIADMAGEGLQWLGAMRFRLSADRACLTELTAGDARPAGCRCPYALPDP